MEENKRYFWENQRLLLKLANSEEGRAYLRLQKKEPVIKITPNSVHYLEGFDKKKIYITTDFYTYDRLAELLIPVITKMEIADEYKKIEDLNKAFLHYTELKRGSFPQIFLATTDFNPTTGEGNVNSGSHTSWANAKADSVGSATANPAVYAARFDASTWFIIRAFAPFDTSSLPDSAVISAALFRFYRDDSLDSFSNADSTSLIIVPSTQASPTALANEDLDAVTFSNKGSLAFASTSNGAYNEVSITDLTIISKTGYTQLAGIAQRDLDNSAPTGINILVWQNRSNTNPVILRVTHALPGGGNPIMFQGGGIALG